MKKRFRKEANREDGQAMVEFALILPIFLLNHAIYTNKSF